MKMYGAVDFFFVVCDGLFNSSLQCSIPGNCLIHLLLEDTSWHVGWAIGNVCNWTFWLL